MPHRLPTRNPLYRTIIDDAAEEFRIEATEDCPLVGLVEPAARLAFEHCNSPANTSEIYNFLGVQIWAYECGIDSRVEIPVYAELAGDTDTYELYIRDTEGGEYQMWTGTEFAQSKSAIRAAITAVKDTYESPADIISAFNRTQITMDE